MNKLYNIPCFNEIPIISVLFIVDRASLPKSKRKMEFWGSDLSKNERNIYYEWVLQHTLIQIDTSISALLIDEGAFPKNKREIKSQ